MPSRKRHLVVLLLAAWTSSTALADWESSLLPKGFDHASQFEAAQKMADEKGKAVLLYYTRTNCPPCNVLQGRLRDPEIGNPFKDAFVVTAVWGNALGRTERESYRSRFDVQSAPTWVFFSGKGQYVCTARGGFWSAEEATRLRESVKAMLATDSSTSAPRACL